MKRTTFAARPHLLWQREPDGGPLLVGGKLQPVLINGALVVSHYTPAINGEQAFLCLTGFQPIPWKVFKTKRASVAFIAANDLRR